METIEEHIKSENAIAFFIGFYQDTSFLKTLSESEVKKIVVLNANTCGNQSSFNFLGDLEEILEVVGFSVRSEDKEKLTESKKTSKFENPLNVVFQSEMSDTIISYHFNTSLEMSRNVLLKEEMTEASILYVHEYEPRAATIEYLNQPITILIPNEKLNKLRYSTETESLSYYLKHEFGDSGLGSNDKISQVIGWFVDPFFQNINVFEKRYPRLDDVAVVIGAGCDMAPVRALRNDQIKTFLFVDSGPRESQNGKPNSANFIEEVDLAMRDEGFYIHEEDNGIITAALRDNVLEPFVVRFYSQISDRVIFYHFNTLFGVDKNEILDEQMLSASTLVIHHVHPHKSVLDKMKKPVHLAILKGTNCGADPDDTGDSVIKELHGTGFGDLVQTCRVYYQEYHFKSCKTMEKANVFCDRFFKKEREGGITSYY